MLYKNLTGVSRVVVQNIKIYNKLDKSNIKSMVKIKANTRQTHKSQYLLMYFDIYK
jgi:hypothetical protein